jgi:hypothetical protein
MSQLSLPWGDAVVVNDKKASTFREFLAWPLCPRFIRGPWKILSGRGRPYFLGNKLPKNLPT